MNKSIIFQNVWELLHSSKIHLKWSEIPNHMFSQYTRKKFPQPDAHFQPNTYPNQITRHTQPHTSTHHLITLFTNPADTPAFTEPSPLTSRACSLLTRPAQAPIQPRIVIPRTYTSPIKVRSSSLSLSTFFSRKNDAKERRMNFSAWEREREAIGHLPPSIYSLSLTLSLARFREKGESSGMRGMARAGDGETAAAIARLI